MNWPRTFDANPYVVPEQPNLASSTYFQPTPGSSPTPPSQFSSGFHYSNSFPEQPVNYSMATSNNLTPNDTMTPTNYNRMNSFSMQPMTAHQASMMNMPYSNQTSPFAYLPNQDPSSIPPISSMAHTNETSIQPYTRFPSRFPHHKSLVSSKRAEQNRAAQRAFRQRKDQYIKSLEQKAKDFQSFLELLDQWKMNYVKFKHSYHELKKENQMMKGIQATDEVSTEEHALDELMEKFNTTSQLHQENFHLPKRKRGRHLSEKWSLISNSFNNNDHSALPTSTNDLLSSPHSSTSSLSNPSIMTSSTPSTLAHSQWSSNHQETHYSDSLDDPHFKPTPSVLPPILTPPHYPLQHHVDQSSAFLPVSAAVQSDDHKQLGRDDLDDFVSVYHPSKHPRHELTSHLI